MALFTMLMGNAFAAFPVMTAAVGLPVVVRQFGGEPAVVCAIGMLSSFCGTLMTPMAANFNIVPANLLELPDRDAPFNAVIRTQIPTARQVTPSCPQHLVLNQENHSGHDGPDFRIRV